MYHEKYTTAIQKEGPCNPKAFILLSVQKSWMNLKNSIPGILALKRPMKLNRQMIIKTIIND